jgi:hypothetical protein
LAHVSTNAAHAPNAHAAVHGRSPGVPQAVVHAEGDDPIGHASPLPSSMLPLQSSSMPLHVSAAPGEIAALESLQSLPPAHPAITYPSLSPSTPALRHAPLAASQLSAVHVTPSSQSTGVPARQPNDGSHVSTPLHESPSSQSASSAQAGGSTHPLAASHD